MTHSRRSLARLAWVPWPRLRGHAAGLVGTSRHARGKRGHGTLVPQQELRRQSVARLLRCAWLILLPLACGCGGSGLVSVSGTVTFDGKPLQTGSVSFQPVGQGPLGYAAIQSDGTYTVRTGTEAGLMPGEYQVTVVATGAVPEPTPQNPEPLPDLLIPARYGSAQTSGLRFTAGSSGGRFDIALTSQ